MQTELRRKNIGHERTKKMVRYKWSKDKPKAKLNHGFITINYISHSFKKQSIWALFVYYENGDSRSTTLLLLQYETQTRLSKDSVPQLAQRYRCVCLFIFVADKNSLLHHSISPLKFNVSVISLLCLLVDLRIPFIGEIYFIWEIISISIPLTK